ncbi:putative glycoside hydrolase [Actinomyces slackii]|uniref:Glycoside-hydrolase family GH114 TIM-barrel domain-containing protein n=1 Tax=Actinomyces slackii TaxID=52774 RepID=A0A448KBL5_9ACTO|nr:putative glycoside hydrolase [Actinomyces slackii]VEG74328.1 Uncharacterised protein [Actinomyces slackii]
MSVSGVGAWIRYGDPLEPAEIDFAIQHYRAAILQPWEAEAAARIKDARPDMTVLAYRCLSSARDFEPPERCASGLTHAELTRRDWLARRGDGSLVEWSTYPGHFQARVWDEGYRARWVEQVCQDIEGTAFDGIMSDNDVFDDYYGLSFPLEEVGSAAELRRVLDGFVAQVGAGLAGVGKILVPNIAEARREPGRWERHAAWGGGFDECWLGWGGEQLFDEPTALAQIHQLRGPGVSIVRTPDGGSAQAPHGLYGLAAFWVFGAGQGAYTATGHDDYSRTPWFPALDADLGAPLTGPRREAGAWTREFEGGVAAVVLDPQRQAELTLPSGLVLPGPDGRPDGQALPSNVVLPGHHGLIGLRP